MTFDFIKINIFKLNLLVFGSAFIIGLSCSHFRVVRLFLTLYFKYSNCQPIAYECASYDQFLRGLCASCDNNRCTYVGYEEQIGFNGQIRDIPDAQHRRVFMKTDSELPFCRKFLFFKDFFKL